MTPVDTQSDIAWESRLLAIVAAALVVFGIAAVYSASSIWAVQDGQPGAHFALRQLIGVVIGGLLLIVVSRIDYHVWRAYAWPLLGVITLFLLVPILPFGHAVAPEVNGARRWIVLGPLTLQPSEFAKFSVVAWTAMLAARKGRRVREFKRGVLPFVVIMFPIAALVVFEPDLSGGIILVLLSGIVLFAAGAKIGHFLLLALAAVPLLWHEIASAQYRLARMVSFLSAGSELGESSWQINQSLIGIGAGQLAGVGFGEGLQKLGYLPYAYSDFIFSTIGEEWGFLGAATIIGLYALFAALGFRIAGTAPDAFGMLLTTGLTAMIGLTAFLHIAVTLGLVPTTGISLPFISFGRSNLLVSLIATGVIMNVARRRGAQRSRR